MSAKIRRRWGYLIALIIVIAMGLLSRRASFLPNETGDALWVIAVYCLYRMTARLCQLELIYRTCGEEINQRLNPQAHILVGDIIEGGTHAAYSNKATHAESGRQEIG